MKVMLAQSAGFCFGVRRAVQLAEKIAAGDAPYVMLGPVIHNDHVIEHLAEQGVAILMISSELPELIGMSDRIYVMRRGTVSAEITDRAEFQQEKILSYTV